ncbi:MAG TPA: hypothetical protein VNI55_12440, partial [Gaiellaceae bacterium]|nr:hypothetical protein [Gaiellaceae bacterium]
MPPLRILFFLLAPNFDRVFASFLESLLERGHTVHVLIQKQKQKPGRLPSGGGAILDELAARYPSFTVEGEPTVPDRWLALRTGLRAGIDYVRYLEPELVQAHALRRRARKIAPVLIRMLVKGLKSVPRLRRPAAAALGRLERVVPIAATTRSIVSAADPDVVLVAPLVGLGARQSDWIRVAADLGIPTVLPVASWDNLTNKGVLKQIPTRVIVWNDAQAAEAIDLHRVPAERIVVTGAHAFDHWFEQGPRLEREAFHSLVGLPLEPFFLYAGSSYFIARYEPSFFRTWLEKVRSSDDPALRDVGVLVRPHPQNARGWSEYEPDDDRVVVWPRGGASPTDAGRREDYFHSLWYSAGVVGINTSALIEAAIARRPSFTLLLESFRETQVELPHFAHVASGPNSLVIVGEDW